MAVEPARTRKPNGTGFPKANANSFCITNQSLLSACTKLSSVFYEFGMAQSVLQDTSVLRTAYYFRVYEATILYSNISGAARARSS